MPLPMIIFSMKVPARLLDKLWFLTVNVELSIMTLSDVKVSPY